ncbi:MAG: hypothetical protein ACMG50_09545 [Thermomonas sp.]
MTRKLHNTLMATIASSGLLVAGFIASTPVTTELNAGTATAVIESIDSQAVLASDVIYQAETPLLSRARSVRHSRQSLAMPFFSFAPRS